MVECGCGELCVDRRQRYVLTLRERLDLAPRLRNPFIEWKEPACETNAQIAIEPALKCAAFRFIFVKEVDPFSDLANGDDAQVQEFLGCGDDPVSNGTRRARLHQFRDDVRVEQ